MAEETGQTSRVRYLEHYGRGLELSGDLEDELISLDFDLDEGFPEMREVPNEDYDCVHRNLRIDSELKKAQLLLETGAIDEAERMANLLEGRSLPEHGLSTDACFTNDGQMEGKLRLLLAELCEERGDDNQAADELCRALDVFWREMDLFELDTTLHAVANLTRHADPVCANRALGLTTRIPRLIGDRYTELQNLVIKVTMGFGSPLDAGRARDLLEDVDIEPEERAQLESDLRGTH